MAACGFFVKGAIAQFPKETTSVLHETLTHVAKGESHLILRQVPNFAASPFGHGRYAWSYLYNPCTLNFSLFRFMYVSNAAAYTPKVLRITLGLLNNLNNMSKCGVKIHKFSIN